MEVEQQKTEKGEGVKEPLKKKQKRVPKKQGGKRIANNGEMTHAPCWNDSFQHLSLMFPMDNSYSSNKETLSWISKETHIRNTSSPSYSTTSICSCHEKKVAKKTTSLSKKKLKEDEVFRTRRSRIKPTEEQKKLFYRWFGVTRCVCNEALWLITEGGWKPSFKPLKPYLLNQGKNTKRHLYSFIFDHDICPIDAKDIVVKELCDTIAATRESFIAKKKSPNYFQMKVRAKKDSCQRVLIPNNRGNPCR